MSITHKNKKIIIFDFDGTIIESNFLKEKGFLELYKRNKYSTLRKIINFHRSNMGLNRFEKFRFINEEILNISYNKAVEQNLNNQYSNYIKNKIKECKLVKGSFKFLHDNYKNFLIYLCSVTIENDLIEIVTERNLKKYFIEVKGGPLKKLTIIENIIKRNKFSLQNITYVGDSESDMKLANKLKLNFIGIRSLGSFQFPNNINVISDLKDLESLI